MVKRIKCPKSSARLQMLFKGIPLTVLFFGAIFSLSVYAQDVPVPVDTSAPLAPESALGGPDQQKQTPAAQSDPLQEILALDPQNPTSQTNPSASEQGAVAGAMPLESTTDSEIANVVFKAGAESEKKKSISSLFFTESQFNTLNEAIMRRNNNASIEEGDVRYSEPSDGMEEGDEERVKPANREVYLSGLVFVHEKDWTVWLNGMRIKPDAIPDEIKDIKVYKTHIDIKWFDEYNNKIYPIRLKPHQRFNVDTHVFLPG